MNPLDFAAFPTGNLCNADPRVSAIAPAIRPLIPGKRIAGRARTARITPGQNGAIHRAVHHAVAGEVLVVDGGGAKRFGPFGDLLADGCLAKGVAVIPSDAADKDLTKVAAVAAREETIRARIHAGETTLDIFELAP